MARQSEMLNNRPLSVKYIQENLLTLTPNKLLYGQRGGEYPEDLDLNLQNNRLYYDLNKLEVFLEEWKKVWSKSYLQELQKFLTFKNSGRRELRLGSVVLISDHLNKKSRFPALGQVTEILSPRTFKLRYVKREVVFDKHWKMVRPAVCAVLTRPIQNLIWLCDPEEGSFATLDPFTPTDDPDNARNVGDEEEGGEVSDGDHSTPADDGPVDGEVRIDDSDEPEVRLEEDADVEEPVPEEFPDPADDFVDELESNPASAVITKPRIKVKFISEADSEIKDLVKVQKTRKSRKTK